MKKNELLEKRNSALDIVRIIAVISVCSVHFFLNNGFYGDTVPETPMMFLTIQVRTLTSVCVPLFMILTGYLMSKKEISKGYYKGIRKTLIVYLLATLACMIVKSFSVGEVGHLGYIEAVEFTLKDFILGILNYSGANYSWYIEMYIGLFLIAPFLNAAYNGLKTQKQKQLLVFTIFAVSVLPTLLNNFNFDTLDWWLTPRYTEETTKILPSAWTGLYPVAYYFAGAYFREYGMKIKTVTLLLSFVTALFLFGTFNFTMFIGQSFRYGPFLNWHCFQVYVLSCALFVLLTRIPANKLSDSFRTVLWRVADLALGAYLLSFIFDRFVYNSWFSSDSDMSGGACATQMSYIFLHVCVAFGIFLLVRLLAKKLQSETYKWLLWRATGIVIGVYLLIAIFAHYNKMHFESITYFDADMKITRFFVMVIPVLVCSFLASLIVNCLADLLIRGYELVRDFVKKQLARDDRSKWQDYAFIALLAGGVTFAIWKARYGFGGNDEAFYLTIPHRLGMGDALFRDEWHLSQMSGVLMIPFVKIYTMLVGSCEGIMLAARFFYVCGHAAVTVLLYLRIRKYGPLTLFASILFFMYTPYNIMAYSYNTMAVDLLVITGVLMGTGDYSKKLPLVFAGLAFAGAVLCSPYLAIAYALFAVCVLAHFLIKTFVKGKNFKFALTTDLFAPKTFLWFTIGAASLAVVVTVYMLSKVSVGDIFSNLDQMLKDPEHVQMSIWDKLKYYQQFTVESHDNFYMSFWAYGAVLFVMICDIKRRKHRAPYLIASIMITVFSYIQFIPLMEWKYYNAMMYPMIFVGITSYILCEKKPRELMISMFTVGILYSFAVCFSSNQYFYVISMAISISNIASLVFLARLIREMRESEDNLDYALFLKRTAFAGVAFMLALLGFCEIAIRTNACFWEGKDLSILDTQITCGPAKGIYTTQDKQADYEAIYNDLKYYKDVDKDNILILSEKTWCYLAVHDMPYGTFSAWLSGENYTALSRLDEFYIGNPDKIPKYVYVPLNSKWDMSYLRAWLSQHGYYESGSNSVGMKYVKP